MMWYDCINHFNQQYVFFFFIYSFHFMATFPHGGHFTARSLMKAYVATEGDPPMPALGAQ